MAARPAQNVFQALNFCNPDYSIEDDMKIFYVDRGGISPIDEMEKHLLYDWNYPKLLFTGPKGYGKATELIKLSKKRSIRKNFYVKIFSANDLTAVEPIKLIIEILKKIKEIADKEKISISKEVDEYLNFNYGWSTDVEIYAPASTEIADVSWIDASKPNEKTVKLIKKKPAEIGAPKILKLIAQAAEQIYHHKRFFRSKKDVLIIVTDLDKIDQKTALSLFRDNVSILTAVKCFIIYTFPFELCQHPDFPLIQRNFSDIYYFSHSSPWSRQISNNSWEYRTIREILTKRIMVQVFEPPEIIDDIINYSGGIPSRLLELVKSCALISSRDKVPWWWIFFPSKRKISRNILTRVIERIKGFYRNTLSEVQLNILRYINRTNDYPHKNENDFLALLNQNLTIQYGKENDIWYEVNPIVQELLLEISEPEEE